MIKNERKLHKSISSGQGYVWRFCAVSLSSLETVFEHLGRSELQPPTCPSYWTTKCLSTLSLPSVQKHLHAKLGIYACKNFPKPVDHDPKFKASWFCKTKHVKLKYITWCCQVTSMDNWSATGRKNKQQ